MPTEQELIEEEFKRRGGMAIRTGQVEAGKEIIERGKKEFGEVRQEVANTKLGGVEGAMARRAMAKKNLAEQEEINRTLRPSVGAFFRTLIGRKPPY